MEINKITEAIIGASIEVHRIMGPGLLESVYEKCLCLELKTRKIPFEQQLLVPVTYGDLHLDSGFRLDLLVNNEVVVELKSVDCLLPIHKAQLLTYLKLGGWKVGLLINFNVSLLKNGIQRVVLELDED